MILNIISSEQQVIPSPPYVILTPLWRGEGSWEARKDTQTPVIPTEEPVIPSEVEESLLEPEQEVQQPVIPTEVAVLCHSVARLRDGERNPFTIGNFLFPPRRFIKIY